MPSELESAQNHVRMYEESIAVKLKRIQSGDHLVDEAATRKWLAIDEQKLEEWKRPLTQAERAAKIQAKLEAEQPAER